MKRGALCTLVAAPGHDNCWAWDLGPDVGIGEIETVGQPCMYICDEVYNTRYSEGPVSHAVVLLHGRIRSIENRSLVSTADGKPNE